MNFDFKRANINYVQISYKQADSSLCFFKVGIKEINDKTILVTRKSDKNIKLDTDDVITLNIVCEDGIYKGQSKIKYIKHEPPYMYILLDFPQDLTHQQNREYFRIEEKYKCTCIYKDNGRLMQCDTETIDISANGISLMFNKKLTPESSVRLILNIKDKVLEIVTRVVRAESFNNYYKLSLAFTKISESDRDYISQICIQKQILERRNNLR